MPEYSFFWGAKHCKYMNYNVILYQADALCRAMLLSRVPNAKPPPVVYCCAHVAPGFAVTAPRDPWPRHTVYPGTIECPATHSGTIRCSATHCGAFGGTRFGHAAHRGCLSRHAA